MILMVSLIFGGCCANVFALEAIIKEQPTAGPLITFAQFAICALFTIPSFLSPSAGPQALFLNPRGIPLRSWVIYTAYFVSVNLLNNWAFAYKISVPLHIILRSAGPVASMVIGYVYNAAMADAQSKGVSIHVNSDAADTMTTVMGFTILALAMVLSAFQGIYADRLYATYGRGHWKEALFYSHALSLPLFLTSCPQLLGQWRVVASSPSLLSHLDSDLWVSKSAVRSTVFSMLGWICQVEAVEALLAHLPVQVAFLAMNALTQYLCIRGVHLLSARSSSLTVTIFLNVRKLVSLLLSIYLFGNHLARGVLGGAALVFVGGGLYGFEGARLRSVAKKAQ
ncbi:UPD-GlcNAc transporter (Mnn2-2), putative [Penicillium digitatum]|uniref:UPD-GlcNAc transporter (Mnn2-2), putative n=1 Tax=Penicillium digitatum TaxID=36651 RepID=A0A7T6XST4_PENDI|nr:UPD-GlcNAc transporter (Mnn2-2), putative [Penicillium digitatum]